MSDTNSKRYSGVAMTLHWLIAAGVIANWRIAEAAEHAVTDEAKSQIMGNHFAIGVTILVLILLRFAWRFVQKPPALSTGFAGWERMLAKATHATFYILLIVMPLAGWFAMSKYGAPINVFGIFSVPPLPVAPDPEGAKAIFEAHGAAGVFLLILVAVHILGTLKHTFIDKDGNLYRMLPFGEPKA